MLFFTYQDYLNCKKILNHSACCVMEKSIPYSLDTSFVKDPHDKLYRDLLNNKTEFSLFLKHFLNYDISPNHLAKYNRSFITNEYKNQYADIVYKVIDKPIFFLVEHQSYIDYSLPYRLFEYYAEILRSCVNKKDLKNKDAKFPCICPIVLYVGEENWKLATNIGEKQFSSQYKGNLDIPYHFISIHQYTKENLIHLNSCIAYAMALYKCQTEEELINLFVTLSKQNITIQRKHTFQRILQFLMKNFLDDETIALLLKKFNEEGIIMDPLVERMKKDRIKYGLEMEKKGISQGISQGKFEIIKNMLKCGLSIDEIKKYSGCTKGKIEEVKRELKLSV